MSRSEAAQSMSPEPIIAFDRRAPGLVGIAVKGFLLSLVTFSIYRFWYITNLRRFFWSRTVVAGSPAEYLGTGKELFLGFLVALAILVPFYLVVFIASLASPILAVLASPLSFVFLFVLGQYALFRGRRYRASRTRWRGIRLGQDGSGLTYAGLASLWWAATLLTLGIAFPFMRAALERYRIDHTLIGQSRMKSTATGRSILFPWMLFYVVGLLPILACVCALLTSTDFHIPTDLLIQDPSTEKSKWIFNSDYDGTDVFFWAKVSAMTACVSLPMALILIPYYRARETRAFLNAARLGDARLRSTLKARQFYWPYLFYLLVVIGFLAVIGILVPILAPLFAPKNGASQIHLVQIGLAILLYLLALLGSAVIHVKIITARLWYALTSTTEIDNLPALEALLGSSRKPGSMLNEGLADALDIGGAIEIGF